MSEQLTEKLKIGYLGKVKAFIELIKLRLSLLVVFSGGIGFILASGSQVNSISLIIFSAAALLITGSANAFNQIIEKESDKLMKRTAGRPLPAGKLGKTEALVFASVIGLIGLVLITVLLNPFSAALAALSMLLYTGIYTPMKKVSSFSVAVGAIPGALPPLIGWAAAAGELSLAAFILFGIQFIWQFPHFWAIAWVLDEDYKRAGFKMLPGKGERNLNTAFQIMIYTLFLIPVGLLPARFGIAGLNSAIIVTVCGVLFLMQTFYLMKEGSEKAAKLIMFGSFLYLPIVQISLVLDKI